MKKVGFAFNLRELAGSMGDMGTLFPLAIGYMAVCGLNPAGLLVMMGLANIATGLVYRLPMPIEPMKVIAVVAIAQQWSASMVYAAGFGMGVVWLFLGSTSVMVKVAKLTPDSVIRGIQVALGLMLAREAFSMAAASWPLALASFAVIVLLRRNRFAPAAIVLVIAGIALTILQGQTAMPQQMHFHLPEPTAFTLQQVWQAMVLAGFAQIPVTATNAVIATAALIKTYWPDKTVTEKQLSLNMGIMNIITPFWGGMPLCHGAGGLAGQYYFGARTGGTNIIEGVLEITLGLLMASSVAGLFAAFPSAILGAMMCAIGLQLIAFAKDMRLNAQMLPFLTTVAVSLETHMVYGFLSGIALHFLLDRRGRRLL